MADPQTATIRLTQPTAGGDSGTWGTILNNDMVYTDAAVNGIVTVNVPDTNVTLLADGSSGDQARYAAYNFTGALTADRTITLPANAKVGLFRNATTGGKNLVLTTGSGTTITSAASSYYSRFICDSVNLQFVVGGTPAASGYLGLGPITIQWGTGVIGTLVTFPKAFSSAAFDVQITMRNSTVVVPTVTTAFGSVITSFQTTAINLSGSTVTGGPFYWIATGPT